jgi:hypothetical protein
MSNNLNILSNINKSVNQQHPFHVLGLSRLPVFMATFVGSLAIVIIIKLQNIINVEDFLSIGVIIMNPFFNINGISLLSIPEHFVDIRILQILFLIVITL